ncbi:hypothetical protein [Acinetobacter sp. YH16032]|uniref:hypothetical protein n=1 Tax=Acinetobacter sp. YH16032 TaxID=2601181 RepID=UPI0015D35474|nr:hypothetical protein [Acinetobacter sp. YH16032]
MSEILLQMWEPQRQSIIESHQFYVEQAKSRLLLKFDNIEEESERYVEEWLDKRSKNYFDPDFHDPAEIYEQANDEMVDFYLNLQELHKNVLFSILSGMFHKWEKELREWLINEMRHWRGAKKLREKIWSLNIKQIFDLFKDFGWDIYSEPFFEKLDTCRVLVNVYKHGNGNSFEELKQKYPEYIVDPLASSNKNYSTELQYLDHTNVEFENKHLDIFEESITNFWKSVPQNIFEEDVISIPNWLQKIWK